ncbi:Dimethyladenosine transferase 1, mitochondrial [Lobulomyces angularis]|nr:Dimethyladenosine transferase 1, mitochondrial [Lobulomyces angularis]
MFNVYFKKTLKFNINSNIVSKLNFSISSIHLKKKVKKQVIVEENLDPVSLPTFRHLTQIYGIQAKKYLSQNFIFDQNISDKVLKLAVSEGCVNLEKDVVIEIGPGLGSLTRSAINLSPEGIYLIEKDPLLKNTLVELKSLSKDRIKKIFIDDALHFKQDALMKEILAMAPKKIHIIEMTFLFQSEIGEKLTAKPGTKFRGRLTNLFDTLCTVKDKFYLTSQCFVPVPKVDVAVLKIIPRKVPLIPEGVSKEFERVVTFSFLKKRKTITNSLKSKCRDIKSILKDVNIDGSLRPEELTTEEFIRLYTYLTANNIRIK